MTMHDATDVLAEFRRRDATLTSDTYSLTRDANLFFYQGRTRHALALLRRAGFFPCPEKTVLEIGCGARGWLPDFESWGVPRANLAGIDLDESRSEGIRRLLSGHSSDPERAPTGGADIRVGDASNLPWADATFDAVIQSTVFTSILAHDQRRNIAREMLRVLKHNGLILWYDFVYDNPSNRNVQGVRFSEVRRLFTNCTFESRLTTLAPPLARFIVPCSWLLAEILQSFQLLNTHRLIVIRKSSAGVHNPNRT